MPELKVLIVDDEPGIRSGINRVLRNYSVGYPFMDEDFEFGTTEASTGEEAIEILEKQAFDIVLLDNKLPGIEGIDVLEYINKKKMDLAVMMITSYASLELAIKATRNGAYNFVPKPFTPDELRASMESIAKHLYLKRITRKMQQEGKQIRFQFLSVLSHELKAPLNAVDGYLKMIRERQLGENIEAYNEMIDRSIERIKGMRNLILDLLDLTKIESGKPTQHLETVDVRKIVQLSMDTLRPYAIQKDVDIYLNTKDPILMKADAGEIEIIMNNLISNAVKYNKTGGRVDIFIEKLKDLVRISVSDTGIGLSDQDKNRIFDDFVRIKNQKTRDITGSGLGLSIVRKIVDMYHGTIEVNSVPEKGSTFIISLINSESTEQNH